MSKGKNVADTNNKKSHAEIRKSRGEEPVSGLTKIQGRLQRRLQRLIDKGGISSKILPNLPVIELSKTLTKAQIIKAENAFERLMAKYNTAWDKS